MAATCELKGKIMAYASETLFETTMWTAVPLFAKTVSHSHNSFKMLSRLLWVFRFLVFSFKQDQKLKAKNAERKFEDLTFLKLCFS